MILQLQQGLRADGFEVSISKLCYWFNVPRAHAVLQTRQGGTEAAISSSGSGKGHDRRESLVWLPYGGVFVEYEQEHGATYLSTQMLAGQEATRRVSTPDSGAALVNSN